MKEIIINISLSDEAFELLKLIKKERYAEYRDIQYQRLEDFKRGDEFKNNRRTAESFLARNTGGTYYLISELLKHNLIEMDSDSWHSTYIISEFGEDVLSKNQ